MRTRAIIKSAALCCAVLVSTLSPAFAAPQSGAPSGDPIKIGAIFGVTGPAAYLGAPEEKTARMVVDEINKDGGILGRQVQLIVKDSVRAPRRRSPSRSSSSTRTTSSPSSGPTTSGESMAIKDICQKAGMPLISCASAETHRRSPSPSTCSRSPQKDNYIVEWIYQTMNKLGISKIGVIASNTGFGNGGKAQLEKYALEVRDHDRDLRGLRRQRDRPHAPCSPRSTPPASRRS